MGVEQHLKAAEAAVEEIKDTLRKIGHLKGIGPPEQWAVLTIANLVTAKVAEAVEPLNARIAEVETLKARIKELEKLGPLIERLLGNPTYAEELGIRTCIAKVLRGGDL